MMMGSDATVAGMWRNWSWSKMLALCVLSERLVAELAM
jgi:hypothetical protein